MSEENIDTLCEALIEASQYEGTEQGELWRDLAELWNRYSGFVSDKFKVSLKEEIQREFEHYRNNYEFVETEVTRTTLVKDLVWKEQ